MFYQYFVSILFRFYSFSFDFCALKLYNIIYPFKDVVKKGLRGEIMHLKIGLSASNEPDGKGKRSIKIRLSLPSSKESSESDIGTGDLPAKESSENDVNTGDLPAKKYLEKDIGVDELLANARDALTMSDVCGVTKPVDRKYYYWLLCTIGGPSASDYDERFVRTAERRWKFNTQLDKRIMNGARLCSIEYYYADGISPKILGVNFRFEDEEAQFESSLTPLSTVVSKFICRFLPEPPKEK